MLYDFLAHLTMLHGLHPAFDKGGGNSVFWTLAREEYFYALYFIFLIFRRRIGIIQTNVGVLLLSACFPIIMSYVIPMSTDWWEIVLSSAISLWFQWTLGTIAVEAYLGIIKLPPLASHPLMTIFWAALAFLTNYLDLWALDSIFWGMCFFTLLNYCVDKEKDAGEWTLFSDTQFGRFFARVGMVIFFIPGASAGSEGFETAARKLRGHAESGILSFYCAADDNRGVLCWENIFPAGRAAFFKSTSISFGKDRFFRNYTCGFPVLKLSILRLVKRHVKDARPSS
jgi:hypothetical protein